MKAWGRFLLQLTLVTLPALALAWLIHHYLGPPATETTHVER